MNKNRIKSKQDRVKNKKYIENIIKNSENFLNNKEKNENSIDFANILVDIKEVMRSFVKEYHQANKKEVEDQIELFKSDLEKDSKLTEKKTFKARKILLWGTSIIMLDYFIFYLLGFATSLNVLYSMIMLSLLVLIVNSSYCHKNKLDGRLTEYFKYNMTLNEDIINCTIYEIDYISFGNPLSNQLKNILKQGVLNKKAMDILVKHFDFEELTQYMKTKNKSALTYEDLFVLYSKKYI